MSTTTAQSTGADEAELLRLVEEWRNNLEARNLDRLMAGYAEDIVLFDVKPPYKITGKAAYRANWEACLPFFPTQFKSEHRDLNLTVSGELAFLHGLHRMLPIDEPDHPAGRSWVRVTACFQKINGEWKAVHEHVSFPMDCTTGLVSPIVEPI